MRSHKTVWRSNDGSHAIAVGINGDSLHLIAWEWIKYPGQSGKQYGEGCLRMINYDGHPDSRSNRGVSSEDFYGDIRPSNLTEKITSLRAKLWGTKAGTEDICLGSGATAFASEEDCERIFEALVFI